MPPELKNKLKKALAGRERVDMGQFQFVGLDRVRDQAGADWPQLREKVYEVGDHFIEKRLGEDDAVIRCHGGFLIIFKTLEGEAAEAVVRDIAVELEMFFLGDDLLKQVKVATESRGVSTAELLEIVAQSQPEVTPPPAERKGAKSGASDRDMPVWKSTPTRVVDDSDRTRWVAVPANEKRGGKVAVALPEAEYKEKDGVWDDIVFRPVWDSRKRALIHNFCLARRVVQGVAYYGRDTLMGSDYRDEHRALDKAVALAAQRGFQKVRRAGGKSVIVVPVHYDTIATVSQRMSYFAVLQSVPEPMRKYFFLRVDSVPRGAPIGQMQEIFRSMKHFGAYILAHLDYGQTDLQCFESCGVGIFGADLPERLNDRPPNDKDLQTLMDWQASARLLKAETYLTSITDTEILSAAMSAGVRYFSGDRIAPEAALPAPARALSLDDILRPPVDDHGDAADEADTFHV
ncbi:hypothetical protein [Maricaulis sp. CAU 1757]